MENVQRLVSPIYIGIGYKYLTEIVNILWKI